MRTIDPFPTLASAGSGLWNFAASAALGVFGPDSAERADRRAHRRIRRQATPRGPDAGAGRGISGQAIEQLER